MALSQKYCRVTKSAHRVRWEGSELANGHSPHTMRLKIGQSRKPGESALAAKKIMINDSSVQEEMPLK